MAEISLEAGSAAERAALHFRANPGLMMDRHGLAKLLNIMPPMVESVLGPAVNQQLITIVNDGDLGRAWRAGPRMVMWTAGGRAAAPVVESLSAVPPRRAAPRRILPMLDLAKLRVSTDLPKPESIKKGPGVTRHDHVFNLLTKDGMSVSGIPHEYRQSVGGAALNYLSVRPKLKAKCKLQIRMIDSDTFGVWRVAIENAA